jgi:hypothetical protein
VFDPPDDDEALDKHVAAAKGVLSDAGSIPAASTHFLLMLANEGHRFPPIELGSGGESLPERLGIEVALRYQ